MRAYELRLDLVWKLLPKRGPALVLMTIASLSFAIMFVTARLARTEVHWAETALARSVTCGIVALGLARVRGKSLKIRDHGNAWGRSLLGMFSFMLTFYVLGSPGIEAGDVAALGATPPIFIALLAPFLLRERGGIALWVSVGISFLGVVVIAQPRFITSGHLVLCSLLGASLTAGAMIFLKRLSRIESTEAVHVHFAIVTSIGLCFMGWSSFELPSVNGAILLMIIAIAGTVGQLAQTESYVLEDASRLSVFGYLSVVFTQILGVFVLQEDLTWNDALGSLLVIGGSLLVTRRW